MTETEAIALPPGGGELHYPFVQNASTGAIIRMALVNLLLNVVTLSLWRFWGKTRIRRYLWANTAAWGDNAEYTGTGREMFIAFLVVLVAIFLPLSASFGVAQTLFLTNPPMGALLMAGLQILTLVLIGAGLYGARRYRLSRTLWRGIRGGQKGSAWAYGVRLLGVIVLDVLSLGWAMPWGEMALARYTLRNTAIGDRLLHCDATAKGLYGRFVVLWLTGIVTIIIVSSISIIIALANAQDPDAIFVAIALSYAMFLVLGTVFVLPAYAWYTAGVLKRLASATHLDGHSFTFDVKTRQLIGLVIGNGLIIILSLGSLRPWAALRTFRFACANLAIAGHPDFATIHQGEEARSRSGEGLAAVLDGGSAF